jgi:hypothetical protein
MMVLQQWASLKPIRTYENFLPPFYFPTLLFPVVSLPGYLIVFFFENALLRGLVDSRVSNECFPFL